MGLLSLGWQKPLLALIVLLLVQYILLPLLAGFLPGQIATLLAGFLVFLIALAVVFLVIGLIRLFL